MNTKYNIEELLHNLPDYISDNLSDPDLKEAIELKISSDPDFKMEFTRLKETLNFLQTESFELPSDTYFNNLSVRINEAINKETPALTFFERIGISMKIALPVFAVFLIITFLIIYNASFNENSDKSKITDAKTEETGITESGKDKTSDKKSDQSAAENDLKIHNGSELKENKTIDKIPDPVRQIKNGSPIHNAEKSDKFSATEESVNLNYDETFTNSIKDNDNLMLSDNSNTKENISDNDENNDNPESILTEQEDDILILSDTDDEFLEEDIFELTPEEQKEIVEFLKKS